MDLASIVRSKADFLIGMRRRIHAHPELSGREFETAALVREELTKAGIDLVEGTREDPGVDV